MGAGGLVKGVVLLMVMSFFLGNLLWDVFQYSPKKMSGEGGEEKEKSRD